MQGWQPRKGSFNTSESMSSWTWFSLSLASPRMLTEPGVMSKNCSMYSSPAKDSLAELICFERFFVLNFLFPGIIRR